MVNPSPSSSQSFSLPSPPIPALNGAIDSQPFSPHSTIDFSNVNTIWASVLVETLNCLGLKTAVICPGSRSTPLTLAFAQHKQIEAIPVLDERSASFFALGLARQSGLPTALVCTSGTAGANFYPAVIEARESGVPLLLITADRPPELRDCNAGQTIDQQKLYGSFPTWYSELALPSLDLDLLSYLRQTLIHAWSRTLTPVPGPVHLNLPFRDPLAPVLNPAAQAFASRFPANFFTAIAPPLPTGTVPLPSSAHQRSAIPLQSWQTQRGVIIAGPAQPKSPQLYCQAIAQLSQTLGFPVLAEGLSPLRNYADLNPYLIATYDLILRNPQQAAQLAPEVVIRIGDMPTSKELRQWLSHVQPRQWVVDAGDRNLDPLHGHTTHLKLSVEQLATELSEISAAPNPYLKHWCSLDAQLRQTLNQALGAIEPFVESKVAWTLSKFLPPHTPIFIANSMPVRDIEWFWQPGNSCIQPWFNRGANGIDGTLSTALGIAHRQRSSVMLTGDLALLHDTNGFLVARKLVGHLTIVLINNEGGGIFEMLPISAFDPPFEEFFATPQAVNFSQLCTTYGVEHELIQSWEHLQQRLNPLPTSGIRVLEVQTNRKVDTAWRRDFFAAIAATL